VTRWGAGLQERADDEDHTMPQTATAGYRYEHVQLGHLLADLRFDPSGPLDPKPNSAYLVDRDRTIRFRSIWASDERGLRDALTAVATGQRPHPRQSTRKLRPMITSLGYIDGVLKAAGPRATRDLAHNAPPMLLGARLASMFGRLRPERRGLALLGTLALVSAAAVGLLVRG
jgi:hypothetical protein